MNAITATVRARISRGRGRTRARRSGRARADPAQAAQHPGREGDAVERVVPHGQRLPEATPSTTSWWATRPRIRRLCTWTPVHLRTPGARRGRCWWRRGPGPSPPRRGPPRPARRCARPCRGGRRPCPGGAARRSRRTRSTAPPGPRTASSAPRRRRSWGRPAPRSTASPPASRAAAPAGPRRSRWCRRRRGCRGRRRTLRLSITTSGWVKSTTASAPASTRSCSGSPASTSATSSRSSAAATAAQTSLPTLPRAPRTPTFMRASTMAPSLAGLAGQLVERSDDGQGLALPEEAARQRRARRRASPGRPGR